MTVKATFSGLPAAACRVGAVEHLGVLGGIVAEVGLGVLKLLPLELVAALRLVEGLLRLEGLVGAGPEFLVGSDLRHGGISFRDGWCLKSGARGGRVVPRRVLDGLSALTRRRSARPTSIKSYFRPKV